MYHQWEDPYVSFSQQMYESATYGDEYYEYGQQYEPHYDYGYGSAYPGSYGPPQQPVQKRPRWTPRSQHATTTAPPPGREWTQSSWSEQYSGDWMKEEVKSEPPARPKRTSKRKETIELSSGDDEQTEATSQSNVERTEDTEIPADQQEWEQQQYIDQYDYRQDEQYATYQEYQQEDPNLDYDDQYQQDQVGAPNVGADSEVGLDTDDQPWFPPEYYVKHQRDPKLPELTNTAKGEFVRNMTRRPWIGDEEELDETPIAAPKAVVSMGKTKGKAGRERKPRPCWIRLTRKWVRDNFLNHFLGHSNIRYRGMTYASICHHPTSAWDCHALCWQCYVELDLPLCGLQPDIDCPFCAQMGFHARNARNEKLAQAIGDEGDLVMREHGKTGLPSNVYCQQDADEWIKKKGSWETPNPDWFLPNQPVGSCFPECLIPPGMSVKDAVSANPQWAAEGHAKEVKHTITPSKISQR